MEHNAIKFIEISRDRESLSSDTVSVASLCEDVAVPVCKSL
jgi:hypothetical protein